MITIPYKIGIEGVGCRATVLCVDMGYLECLKVAGELHGPLLTYLGTCGGVHYQLKTPYRDGISHVVLELLDFMARLEALVPRPQVNLTR